MSFLVVLVLLVIALWLVPVLFMRGEDLTGFDRDDDPGAVRSILDPDGPSNEFAGIAESIREFGSKAARMSARKRLDFMRQYMDNFSAGRAYSSDFVPANAGGIPAEWVLAPGVDPSNRVLYIHGGAFMAGSPLSHRSITNRWSELTAAAVLAIDYRLMPEHRRRDGITDCRTAYRWILENGPDGASPATRLVLGGDSAGGNLSLSVAAWVRDEGLRQPDAVVAFSPSVDACFSSPSLRRNVASDIMLGPLFGTLLKIPPALRAWLYLMENRINPSNPVVSPVFGDLSNLPPTLIQVS